MNNMKRNACQKCVFAVDDNQPHCGLRGFRSDFNVEYCSAENDTIPNGYELQEDGYFSWVKKKEYPKTYEECCKVMNYCCNPVATKTTHKEELIRKFQFLLLYRDAYWKIAGEEKGLGKPWEPDWTNNNEVKFIIGVSENEIIKCYNGIAQYILAFPTEEMRDAFYENFKELIEICKELL